jgi:DNA-binding transcriptional LysR family regulator
MNEFDLTSIKSLKILKLLYETGSATKTAKALGITQSGVSRSLRGLEETFGFELFIREKNRLFIKPETEELYYEVLRLLNQVENLKHSVVALREFGAFRLSIAAIPGLAFGYVPKLIAKLREINPKLNIYFDVMNTSEVLQSIETEQFTVGFVTLPINNSQLEVETIEDTEAVCILPKDHPLTAKSIIEAKDLHQQHLIVANQPNLAVDKLLKIIQSENIRLRSKTESNIAGICTLTANNVGISIINPITARDLSNPNFVSRPFTPKIDYSFGMIYTKKWRENKIIQILKDCIKELDY